MRREAWEELRRQREADDDARRQKQLAALIAENKQQCDEWRASKADWDAKMKARALGIQVGAIIDLCCAKYSVKPLEILSQRRDMPTVFVRQIIAYLCTEVTRKSLPEIGKILGGRDHTTIVHARDKIRAIVAGNPDFAAQMNDLKKQLGAE